jgi:hypothetical protein
LLRLAKGLAFVAALKPGVEKRPVLGARYRQLSSSSLGSALHFDHAFCRDPVVQ